MALSEFVSYVGSDEGKGRSSGRDTSNEFLFVLDEEVEHSRNGKRILSYSVIQNCVKYTYSR